MELSLDQRPPIDLGHVPPVFLVSCNRREIRDLTDRDREAFLDAMEIWYTVPTDGGKAKYGPNYSSYMSIAAIHGTDVETCSYHQGMQFLTSHAAFDLIVERYLQMIDPTVSLPVWYDSVMFQPDWYESAMGDVENHFMVTGGRFGNVSAIYDPD
ncbi:unnamed protein product [Ectocarpus sp. CCAP 1310/34]|nr:unnamed protein product [Ectocarpus sp. CCAP 1310/34]